jgi:osmotically-inducible protein OsmY
MNMRLLALTLLAALLLTGCRDYEAEANIAAGAQTTTAQINANAQTTQAQLEADAKVRTAQAQADADKHRADKETEQAGIWSAKLPELAVILSLAVLLGIVLVYRGKVSLVRVQREPLWLQQSPAPSRLPSSTPPLQVTVEAQKLNALPVPGDGPGVWLLVRDGMIVGRAAPKQLQ